MKRDSLLYFLDKEVENFRRLPETDGLPEDIFLFSSRLTPIVNIDLLIKDENGRILLSWRDDEYAGSGWHLPGGIVRFKEKVLDRVKKVSEIEIGTVVGFNPVPIAHNEIILEQNTRGHFISFLYDCVLPSEFILNNKVLSSVDPGYLQWHDFCPENLVEVHEMYRSIINDNQ